MRYVLFIFLTFVLSITLIAQKEYKSLFWKIYGNGLTDTSYLYGTMHSKDTRIFQFKTGVIEAFNKSEVYAMELNIDSIDQSSLIQSLIMDSSYTLKTCVIGLYKNGLNCITCPLKSLNIYGLCNSAIIEGKKASCTYVEPLI